MAAGKKRGAKKFGHVANPKPRAPSAKDLHRAAARGRHDQAMGTAGKPGGSKSSGGKGAGREGGAGGADRGGRRSGGGKDATHRHR